MNSLTRREYNVQLYLIFHRSATSFETSRLVLAGAIPGQNVYCWPYKRGKKNGMPIYPEF